jgi:dihydrolipoamide dehydrogenase
MTQYDYDILIIGGGPGGYVAGSYAAQFGKKATVIEKEKLGGCCLNTGCIPTKIILESASRYAQAANSREYGIKAQVTFEWNVMKAHSEKTRDELRKGVRGLLRSRKCEMINGEATIIQPHTVKVGEKEITAENIILATGARPNIPKKFASIKNVITSDTFWNLEKKPESIVIVGGGVIGCEIASALCRLGTKVTILEQMPDILSQFDSDAVEILKRELIKNGVEIVCGSAVSDIRPSEKELLVSCAGKEYRCEYVLWSTGRRAVIPEHHLADLTITETGFVKADSNYCTDVNNIYCIGDANGKCMLAHAAISQAMLVVNHICTGNPVVYDPCVPQTVFTDPQIARLGLRESDCENRNIAVGKIPYAAVGYSHVIEDTNGYYKVIRDIETDTLIGAEIVGHNACELIHILAPYVNKKLEVNAFSDIMFAHPTLSEGIKLAVEASYIRSPQV